ncbi:hypothetical protein COT69_03235 [candidate division WWE3 bacterium CG09_land_8_20_14_0_10_39_24]|uniref:Uncharacterized protein n=1 Tax=candidate division WWE3 bacterium CG09_land_8_20_14_0_10_39_24 TaxID=1975088 RepID=A0A2H0WIW0_UNCKA|nr:MAG: hypothetical protein BK003_03080 [bacterium CG09_39_24]PIS12613.1 MAG: hypothetical protein COT69_03235 [candidate division WWE3 bacterium CG09_land_8_20_14_0_10_39_24]
MIGMKIQAEAVPAIIGFNTKAVAPAKINRAVPIRKFFILFSLQGFVKEQILVTARNHSFG